MPELPEVESVVQGFKDSGLIGKKLKNIDVRWEKICSGGSSYFKKKLEGRTIKAVSRRGKHIVWQIEDFFVAIHLRMSGQFIISTIDTPLGSHEHVAFDFEENLRLIYKDTRKFGRFTIVEDLVAYFNKLGLEPFDHKCTASYLAEAISTTSRNIKALLLDQSIVSGLGNIYVDEALWLSGIHPLRKGMSLKQHEIHKLYDSIRSVLAKAIENKGTSLGDGLGNYKNVNGLSGKNQKLLSVYGKKGEPCIICGDTLKKIICNQRGTTYCPTCQKLLF